MHHTKSEESTEMYLETILMLEKQHPDVHSIEIATAMGFSKPSVSVAMKNLREHGYITMDQNSHICLTASGRKRAEAVYMRHHTLTRFLLSLGVSSETAETDACRMEHFISEETFAAIRKHVEEQEDA